MTDQENMYISAVRYTLGRMTYIVDMTCEFMLKQELSKGCRKTMFRDIERHTCDKEEWTKLLAYLKKHD